MYGRKSVRCSAQHQYETCVMHMRMIDEHFEQMLLTVLLILPLHSPLDCVLPPPQALCVHVLVGS